MSAPITTRREALRLLACTGAQASALAIPVVALGDTPANADAEINALSAEVLRRCEVAEAFQATRIAPFEDRFISLILQDRSAEASTYGRETGRDDAIDALGLFDEETDRIYSRMMAIPSTTQAGRAAKVRALLVHVMRDDWRGPSIDWHREQARALLAEFAGITADEVAAV